MDYLVEIIKEELVKDYKKFQVKLIQLYYNDNYEVYEKKKVEDITDKVCV